MRAVFHEQRVEDGGAGARRAGDEQRLADLLVEHTGIGAHVGRHLEAALEDAQQEAARDPAPEQRELRLLFERGDEHVERLEEARRRRSRRRRSGAGATGRVHAEPGARFAEQAVTRERRRRLLGDREHVAPVHGGDPFGTGIRSAGHGENVRQRADGNSVHAHDREPIGECPVGSSVE